MTISFPSTSVNNDVSFILDFEGILPRDQTSVYRPDILVFRDKTDTNTVSVGNNGAGNLQVISNELYTGTGGFLSTSANGLSLGVDPYTIELLFRIPTSRTSAPQGLLAVNATAAANNWQLALDNLDRVVFSRGTTTEATTVTITDGVLQHIAVVRTGTGTNETKIYLNGVLARTFTDATDYNYTEGLLIGSNRAGGGLTDAFIKAVRISTVARYTEAFTAPSSLSYVAVGDTYSYLDKVYKWSGVKWFDRSKYNANIAGEYRNLSTIQANTSNTSLDLRASNFFDVELIGEEDTQIVLQNEANTQSFIALLRQQTQQGRLFDTFTDTNGTLVTNHTPDINTYGVPYEQIATYQGGSNIVIENNQARIVWGGTVASSKIVIETGFSDVVVEMDLNKSNMTSIYYTPQLQLGEYTLANYGGYLVLRDPNETVLANSATNNVFLNSSSTFKIRGEKSGTNIKAYVNDGLAINYTNASLLQVETKHGFDFLTAGNLDRPFGDNLTIESPVIINSKAVIWPSNISWSTGTAPTISTSTLIEFYKYNGTWHGNVITENL